MRTVAGSSGSDAGRCGTVRGPAGCCTVRPRDGHGRRARRGGSAGAAVQRRRAAADVCRSRRRTSRRFFARQAEDLRAEFSHARSSPALGASALTAAELRLLPLLSTPPVVPGDRRGGLPVPQHHQVDGALDLPQAGNLLTQPGRLPVARPQPHRQHPRPRDLRARAAKTRTLIQHAPGRQRSRPRQTRPQPRDQPKDLAFHATGLPFTGDEQSDAPGAHNRTCCLHRDPEGSARRLPVQQPWAGASAPQRAPGPAPGRCISARLAVIVRSNDQWPDRRDRQSGP